MLTDWKESCFRSIFLKANLLLFAQELVLLRLPIFHFLCAFSSFLTYICLHIAQQQSISALFSSSHSLPACIKIKKNLPARLALLQFIYKSGFNGLLQWFMAVTARQRKWDLTLAHILFQATSQQIQTETHTIAHSWFQSEQTRWGTSDLSCGF